MPALAVAGGDRVALVLAVEDYSHFSKSPITAKTGGEISEALKRHGFDVTVTTNPSNAVARAVLREFAKTAERAHVALVVLSGHGASSAGTTYFLPGNAEITRDTDLLSRGLAVPSVAQIAGKAKHGAVFFLMTVPDVPSNLESIRARPSLASPPIENVVVVFSSSEKVPVSVVDRVSEQAASDFVHAAGETPLLMTALVNAAAAGGTGKVIGVAPELDLSKSLAVPAAAQEVEARRAAEARVRQAEERAREAEARARQAEERPAAISAQEVEARRAAEARVRQAEERAREAEARARQAEERARQETKRAEEATSAPPVSARIAAAPAAAAEHAPSAEDLDSLRIVEALFGRAKRKQVQAELKQLGFYKGEVDAIFGKLTRAAISDYQRSIGASRTGYLTPQQFQELVRN